MEERDKYIQTCPYCGSNEFIVACLQNGAVFGVQNKLSGCVLYHSVCRNCGSVLHSYVKDPEKLLKRKDRRHR